MCTELFVLNSVQPAELFPTPVRSAGIAFIQTFNRLGTIISPLVFIPVLLNHKNYLSDRFRNVRKLIFKVKSNQFIHFRNLNFELISE